METIQQLAPYAFSVHLKDQAVQPYAEGFLLADIPLGEGIFDLRRMIRILRQSNAELNFSLELITRDPLRVPCLADSYWVTMPELPATELARTLRTVGERASESLPGVEALAPEERADLEDANVRASLDFARQHLGL